MSRLNVRFGRITGHVVAESVNQLRKHAIGLAANGMVIFVYDIGVPGGSSWPLSLNHYRPFLDRDDRGFFLGGAIAMAATIAVGFSLNLAME